MNYAKALATLLFLSGAALSAHAGDNLDSVLKCEKVQASKGKSDYVVFISSEGKTRNGHVGILSGNGQLVRLPGGNVQIANSWLDLNEEKILMLDKDDQPVLWIQVKQNIKPGQQPAKAADGKPIPMLYKGEIATKLGDIKIKDKSVTCLCGLADTGTDGNLDYSTWKLKADGCTPNIPSGI